MPRINTLPEYRAISARLPQQDVDTLKRYNVHDRWTLLNFHLMNSDLQAIFESLEEKPEFENFRLRLSEEAIQKLMQIPQGSRYKILSHIIQNKLAQ